MQNNKKILDAPIDASKIGQEDERLRLLAQIKAAKHQAALFGRANEKYNAKRWEDAWAPYYRIATSSAVVGGVISFIIGWAGCTLIATALFGSLMGYTVGTAVAILIEVVKFFCLKYGSENLFAGRTISAGIQLAVGVAALVLSIYTSYQSATQTDVFRQWVAKEAANGNHPEAAGVAEIDKAIAQEQATLSEIERERNSYQEKNKAKSADWLRAKEETASMSEISRLNIERERLTADTSATAAALSWWVYLFILLPDLLVIFGTIFTEYYEYRVYELMVVGGKQTLTQSVTVENNRPTIYQLRETHQQEQEQRTLPPPAAGGGDDATRQELAALREALHALQEQKRTTTPPPTSDNDATRQELAALRDALRSLQEQQRTITPPPPTPEPPTPPPSNGKTEMGFKRSYSSYGSHSSHSEMSDVEQEYRSQDSTTLKEAYSAVMSKRKSWEARDTIASKKNVERCIMRQEAILRVLAERKETIRLVGRAYTIVPIE